MQLHAWWHQAITWTSVSLSLKMSCDIRLKALSEEVVMNIRHNMCSKLQFNKANLRDLIAGTGLVILLKLDSNRRFFSRETPNLGKNQQFF